MNEDIGKDSLHGTALDRLDRIFAVWDLVDGERWLLQDHRGSVRGVIRKDATHQVLGDLSESPRCRNRR